MKLADAVNSGKKLKDHQNTMHLGGYPNAMMGVFF